MWKILSTLALVVLTAAACTKSPVADDPVSGDRRQIHGQVLLGDGASPAGVVIWLEDFQLSTLADSAGDFQLTLQPPSTGSPPGTIRRHKLYFYLANYELTTIDLVSAGSEFLYNREDIDKNGVVREPVVMRRFMSIATAVNPQSVTAGESREVEVVLSLSATPGCAAAWNPGIRQVPNSLLGAILLWNKSSGDLFVVQSDSGATGVERLVVCQAPSERRLRFNASHLLLTPGHYEAIPHILVNPEGVPPPLLSKFSQATDGLNPGYLNKPIRRQGGTFEVK